METESEPSKGPSRLIGNNQVQDSKTPKCSKAKRNKGESHFAGAESHKLVRRLVDDQPRGPAEEPVIASTQLHTQSARFTYVPKKENMEHGACIEITRFHASFLASSADHGPFFFFCFEIESFERHGGWRSREIQAQSGSRKISRGGAPLALSPSLYW